MGIFFVNGEDEPTFNESARPNWRSILINNSVAVEARATIRTSFFKSIVISAPELVSHGEFGEHHKYSHLRICKYTVLQTE